MPAPCPICKAPTTYRAIRCDACGADLTDPDVLAMADAPAQSMSQLGAAGELGGGTFLGCSGDGLADGRRALRAVAALGAGLLAVALLLPVAVEIVGYDEDRAKWLTESVMAWDAWGMDGAPVLALVAPLALVALGFAVALAPASVPARARSGALAALGLAALVLVVGQLGEPAGTPTRAVTLAVAGILVAAVFGAARVLVPTSNAARYGLAAGVAICALGYVLPLGELSPTVPDEYRVFARPLGLELDGGPLIALLIDGITSRHALVLFPSLLALLPVVAAPWAAWAGWKQPRGPWDADSLAVRPLAWFLALIVPATYAMYAFNAMGWSKVGDAIAMPRLRMLLIVGAATMWIVLGGAGFVVATLSRRSPG